MDPLLMAGGGQDAGMGMPPGMAPGPMAAPPSGDPISHLLMALQELLAGAGMMPPGGPPMPGPPAGGPVPTY